MRTKITILSAVALAAGILSSQAQVFSANIVGYVNVPFKANKYTLTVNQLSAATNDAETVLTGIQSGDNILTWNPVSSSFSAYGFLAAGTWLEPDGSIGLAPQLPVGQGFFYQAGAGVNETNTFVGNVVLTNSISMAANKYYLVGSGAPLGESAEGTNINLSLNSGDNILTWDPTLSKYSAYGFLAPGTWLEPDGSIGTAPILSVGQGFFYQTGSGVAEVWTQNVNVH